MQADRFWQAYQYLLASKTPLELLNKAHLLIPAMVMSAFASELYLKCILCLEQGHPHREARHDLVKLFSHVGPAMQKQIEAAWDAQVAASRLHLDLMDSHPDFANSPKKPPRDLRGALEDGRNGFQDIRYGYEERGGGFFVIMNLPPIIRQTILRLKPEYNLAPAVVLDPEPFRIKPEDHPEIFGRGAGKGEVDN